MRATAALIALLIPTSCTWAQLSGNDATQLTQSLNFIGNDPGWTQSVVDVANQILMNPAYNHNDWNQFFTGYWTSSTYTDRLHNYLVYPTLFWSTEAVSQNLQRGMAPPLVAGVESSWTRASTIGSQAFSSDPLLMQHLANSARMTVPIGGSPLLPTAERSQIFDSLANLYGTHASLLSHNVTLDPNAFRFYGALRAQTDMALLSVAPSVDIGRLSLTPAVTSQMTGILGLTGQRANLWQQNNVLYVDNGGSDSNQLQVVQNTLNIVPASLHNVATITVNDYLGNTDAVQGQTIFLTRPYGGVNIFGIRVGAFRENEFPADVAPSNTDVYSIVLAHELNHSVDAYYVENRAALRTRRNDLIAAAGNDRMNYLRSMFDNGFFQSNPQEFVASISNQWFASSRKTLQLGLMRFDAGRPDPINQALFFAEVYSMGGDVTRFYEDNASGGFNMNDIQIFRDSFGHINKLMLDGLLYTFALTPTGNVLSYSITPVAEPALTLLVGSCGVVFWTTMRRRRSNSNSRRETINSTSTANV